MSKISVTIFYPGGLELELTEKTFLEAMTLVWRSPAFEKQEPLKLVFPTTGKFLFMEKQIFNSFLDGETTMKELIEKTECEEVYRNTKNVFVSAVKKEIDSGHLWKLKKGELILIDDDQFVITKLDLKNFEIAI